MITLIAAVASNGVIGNGNALPWDLPSDLAHFKRTTVDHSIIMGRKTFESIGSRPLPRRLNIVLTSRPPAQAIEGVRFVSRLDDAFPVALDYSLETFVIGGAELYRQTIGYAHRLLISHIAQAFEGDSRFPAIEPRLWEVVSRQSLAGDLPCDIVDYRRIIA